jgi:predicted RNase H-like nuclease (RuvC/YqgF family)
MTEIAEPWHEVADAEHEQNVFAGFVERLEDETSRLRSLAEASHATARELAERESSLDAREQALGAAQRDLDARRQELEQWQQELERRASETEQATARIAEAAEREAGLRSLAHDLLQRYGD